MSDKNRQSQPCKTKTLLARLEKCTSAPCFIVAPSLCGQDELLEAFCKRYSAPKTLHTSSTPNTANTYNASNTLSSSSPSNTSNSPNFASNTHNTSSTPSTPSTPITPITPITPNTLNKTTASPAASAPLLIAAYKVHPDGSCVLMEQTNCSIISCEEGAAPDYKTAPSNTLAYLPFVPWLDDLAAQRFSEEINILLKDNHGVIVVCPPQNDRYRTLQSNRIEISAQELKQCGLMPTRSYCLSLKQFLGEFLPLNVRLLAILCAVLGQTNLDELKRLGYELSSDLPLLLEELHPLFTATLDGKGLRAEPLAIQEMGQQLQQIVHEHLEERGQMVSVSLLASRITVLSIALLEKGDLESSHQVLHIAEELISEGVGQRSSSKSKEVLPGKTHDLYHVFNHRAHPVSPLARVALLESSAPPLQLRLFGNLQVYGNGELSVNKYLSRTKIRRLLSFLALNQQRAVSRDTLIEYLWPYLDFERAQKNLYTSWCMLAKGLGSERVKDCPYIQRNGETYQLNSSMVLCDTQLFEKSARGILFEAPDREAQTDRLVELEELYSDSLVADIPTDSFIHSKMEGYRCLMVDALLLTTRQLRHAKELEKALYYARAAYELDESREDVYRELMDTQLEAGQRTSAMQTYFSCKRYLSDELGILPSKSTTALYQDLLLDNCR